MSDSRIRSDLALRRSRIWFAILAGALAVAALLPVDPARGLIAGWQGPGCLLGGWFGEAACPGCGLGRSTALVVQGDWAAAMALNAAGLLVVLLSVGGLVLHGHVLWSGRRTAGHETWLRVGRWIFIAGLSAAWGWRLMIVAIPSSGAC